MSGKVRILAGPPARTALLTGVDRMANLLRPTLGPLPRTVAITRLTGGSEGPEILDDAAAIARKTFQLGDPFENMGAMVVRHLVWQVHERTGDGTATAAVLAQSLMRAGSRLIAAGYSPVSLQSGIQCGVEVATRELRRQARPLDRPKDVRSLLHSLLGGDADAADMLGEVVDSVGPDGAILVEDAQGVETSREYIDGVRWNAGYLSTFLLRPDEVTTSRVPDPRIFVTDRKVERAEQLVPLLEACVAAGERNLFIVAPEMTDAAVGLLVANRERGRLDSVMAVKAPSFGTQRTRILEDIATLTGGRCLSGDRQDRLVDVALDDLGRARQAWATQFAFGILGGRGQKAAIRARIAEAKTELRHIDPQDEYATALIRERIGKLAGTAAVVRVGAPGRAEQEYLKGHIQAAIRSLRSALAEGVVPGGGKALLTCAQAIDTADRRGATALGVRTLARALADPMRVIAINAGFDASPILDRARCDPRVFDVVRRTWVDSWEGGILDPLAVTLTALETSVSAVGSLFAAEVLVHRGDAPAVAGP
jgi:chaperonin GroEL